MTITSLPPKSHYETKEVSSDEDVDEWLNKELSKHLTGQDKEEEEDALIDILKTSIEECKGGISLGVVNEKVKFDMNGEICHSRVPLEKIHMVSSIQESEYFNPHEMENDDSPALEQKTFHYNEESIDTIDSSSDSQENEVGSHLFENVSRWHVYHERQNVEGNRMKFDDFLKLRYDNKNIDDVTREWRYYEWVARNYDFKVNSQRTTKYTDPYNLYHKSDSPSNDTLRINTYFPDISKTQLMKSRIRENSFEEWMKIKLGNINIKDSMMSVMFKEWVNKDFNFEVHFERTKDDRYFRNFDLYTDEFDKEIKQSVNEYELKAWRKRYALEKVWEKCEKFHDSSKQWYDEGFKKEELWQNEIEEIDYTPPLAKNETFEVHRYTIKNEKSFISITKQMNDVLPLGRVNES
nr:phospholipase-like protein [Tanacetum cinerariifolium]